MRGITVFIGFIAIVLAAGPATVLIGRDVHQSSDVDWLPVQIAAAVAVAGFLVCRALRAAASRRFVDASIRRKQSSEPPGWSPAFACTLAGWLLIVVAGGMAFATALVSQSADGPVEAGSYRDNLTDYPLPVLFLFATLALAAVAGHDSWTFRRRHEIPALAAAGVATLAEPPRKLPKKEAVKLRSLMWLRGTVIEGMLFAGALLPRLLPGGERPTEGELATGVFSVIGGPGIVSFVLLVLMIAQWPARAGALEALRQPSSLAAIGIVGVGFALDAGGQEVAGGIVALAGVLIASATCLNIMDRGSQPWLGLVFLVASFILGYLTAPDGGSALPTGVVGWVVTVLAAGYTIREAREHWRTWTKLVLTEPATPQP